MSFADAFLPAVAGPDEDHELANHIEVILQSVVPGPEVPEGLPNVRASNLGFGFSMNWALSDGDRKEIVRATMRQALNRFEPRLISIAAIEIAEDESWNLVEFSVAGAVRRGQSREDIELRSKLSFMNQTVLE